MILKTHINHIGILGGGQLGRMLIQAALDYNLQISVLDPDANAPCAKIAHDFSVGALTDYQTVLDFGRNCQLVTIEIENVNTQALKQLVAEGISVFPQPEIIELIQDKRTQKQFYRQHQIPTAEFELLAQPQDAAQFPQLIPGFFKLGKSGYDGRGVKRITQLKDLETAPVGPGLIERLIPFEKEISVIVARNSEGQVSTFPTVELVFHPEYNLVEYLFAPAQIDPKQDQEAQALARDLINSLGMVGLLAVEMFVDADGRVLVNEVAPRPHNSGHHTIEANITSQYHQHLRAILNLPLGDTNSYSPAAMVNLLGEDGHTGPSKYQGLEEALAVSGVHVHFYGKQITKPFRKMGHVTITDADFDRLHQKTQFVKEKIKIIS